MIYQEHPQNRKELQKFIYNIFLFIGYSVEYSYELQTTRGKKEIDVYAENIDNEFTIKYLCECKFRNKPVNQDVILSYRTVIQDYGANMGLIISKKGFQSGAFNSKKFTNIELLTFEEFQNKFCNNYIKAIGKKLEELESKLRDNKAFGLNISECACEMRYKTTYFNLKTHNDTLNKYLILYKKYNNIGNITRGLILNYNMKNYGTIFKEKFELPIRLDIGGLILEIKSYNELYEVLIKYNTEGYNEFKELFGTYSNWLSISSKKEENN